MATGSGAAPAWDAIVVGGGHNGLVTAAYLARSGRKVLVLERRDHAGCAATVSASSRRTSACSPRTRTAGP